MCSKLTKAVYSQNLVVIACMIWLLRIAGGLNSTHIHGTHVPVDEPSTASIADIASQTMPFIARCWPSPLFQVRS